MSYQYSALFDREWYESIERYQHGNELLRILRATLPATWRLQRQDCWYSVAPPTCTLPQQGWKIHVSATPDACEEILRICSSFCLSHQVAFKCSLDIFCVRLSLSTIWSREASGKFITIYPRDTQQFVELIEGLYPLLRPFTGPYILSDKRYKDCQVLYYRYGGITSIRRLTVTGEQVHLLASPQGDLVPDQRTPYWNPPAWATDPFEALQQEEADGEASDGTLKAGRYQVQEAVQFSVRGGVYLALDTQTGQTVIIKEARPHVHIDSNGHGATERLQQEYALLQRLADTGIVPTPIDLFWDWEHLFLVEEYISGLELNQFVVQSLPLIHPEPGPAAHLAYTTQLKKIWLNLARAIATLHTRGICYGDLSLRNIIVSDSEQGTIRLIDLEAAWEEGQASSAILTTPGFASPRRASLSGVEQDIYAFGSILLGTLFHINPLLSLEPDAGLPFLFAASQELGLPAEITQLIARCLSAQATEQPTLQEAIDVIEHAQLRIPEPVLADARPAFSQAELQTIIGEITSYIHASADYTRADRLFPSDPGVFSTNPLSLAYGATGVAYALFLLEGTLPVHLRSWLLAHPITHSHIPPGLYIGSAGIAWALWEIGESEVAGQTIESAWSHPLLWQDASLFYGATGYGLACLRFWLATEDSTWLARAREVGEWLLNTRQEVPERGYCWPDRQETRHLGYAQGASGIALYLLYLGMLTQDARFLSASEQALAFDLSHLVAIDGSDNLSVPRSLDPDDTVVLPYWRSGSAGIATVLLRFWRYTSQSKYHDLFERLVADASSTYTVFPGLFQGLAGLGNLLLDAYQFTGEEHYLWRAHQTAHGVLRFKLQRPHGSAFPGEHLLRISTDLGTGSAGIALFLQRLAEAREQRHNFQFTLDHLLRDEHIQASQPASV